MNHLDLFSGIGGFSLGLERAGFKTVAFCEIEDYPKKVLQKHWPDVPIYEDVKKLTDEKLKTDGINNIGIITGGFPCQDLSVAGKQKGITAERSGLFFEVTRIISEVQPKYVILENVRNLLSGEKGAWFGAVLHELAKIGYDCEWHCISASAVGAPHQRDRVWIIAYPHGFRLQGRICLPENSAKEARRRAQQFERLLREERELAIPAGARGGVSDGVPNRAHRLKGLGNSLIPQIVELIGNSINEGISYE